MNEVIILEKCHLATENSHGKCGFKISFSNVGDDEITLQNDFLSIFTVR